MGEIFDGEGLGRIPGSSKVPVQVSIRDKSAECKKPAVKLASMLAPWNQPRPGAPTRKITVPRLSEKWYREVSDSCKHLPPDRHQRYNEYAAQYDKQGQVWVPEDKSPKETWRLPKQVYQGISACDFASSKIVKL